MKTSVIALTAALGITSPTIAQTGRAGAADDEYQPNDPVLLYNVWRQAGAAAELHLYERGGHGFDLHAQGMTSDHWFDEFLWWMQARGLMSAAATDSGQSDR